MLLKFKSNYKPTALKRPRLVRNNLVYDPSKKDKKDWLKTVLQYIPKKPLEGPLKINLEFFFPRPKNHFRSGKYKEQIKDSAPRIHTFMPDIDNLAKFILDAMNEHFFLDDRQVVEIGAHKEYINDYHNNKGFTIVTIYRYEKKSNHFISINKTDNEESINCNDNSSNSSNSSNESIAV